MSELRVVGLNESGDRLVLAATDGKQYTVQINDELRAAVRRDRTGMEKLRGQGTATPREIQGLIRAGNTPEHVAQSLGVDVEYVRRFETAVLAERAHVASLAGNAHVSRDVDAPTLNELVINRLAARGVDTSHITWDAAKTSDRAWTVTASYPVGTGSEDASWTFDPGTRQVQAANDAGAALTESASRDEPIRRHLAAVPPAETDRLLDELASRRGQRQPVSFEDVDDEEAAPADALDESSPHAGVEDAEPDLDEAAATPADIAPEPDTDQLDLGLATPPAPAPRPAKRARSAMPSWDEIVFGGKSD